MLGNTGNDRTFLQSIIDTELQQLICLRHFCTFQYRTYADIQFSEIVEFNIFTNWFRIITGFLVCFLRIQQFLNLCFDDAVFDFLEQKL